MIHEKEIFPRLPIPSASGLVSLGLSLWFSRERCPFHYTIFFRQIGPAFRQFAPASRQVTSAIGRRGILSLTAENAIRPFTIGRKNWLFSASVKGACASGIFYSVIATACANGLAPEEYLTRVFSSSPGTVVLPW
jgi:hypothetical protein